MPLRATHPVTFIRARVTNADGPCASSLRMAGGRIVALDCLPGAGDTVIDLEDDIVLPGLINAHDHLELNNFPRMKWRARYENAGEWIADFQPRFETDPALAAARSVPLADRLLLGGIKNLLSGATTVCHHNPLYRQLRRGFPVRVPTRYGYSHSLLIDGQTVAHSHRTTPKDRPWLIHAAEGTDAAAAGEFSRLESLNCIGSNTVLVHGVGLGNEDMAILIARSAGLVWCPSSNDYLYGTSAKVSKLADARRVALGTDSRLSGDRDLLTEIGYAAAQHGMSALALLRMVTVDAAALLKLPDAGVLRAGAAADLLVVPSISRDPLESFLAADRSKIRLIVLGGQARIADVSLRPLFEATKVKCVAARIDGQPKLMARTLAERLRKCAVRESGVEI